MKEGLISIVIWGIFYTLILFIGNIVMMPFIWFIWIDYYIYNLIWGIILSLIIILLWIKN